VHSKQYSSSSIASKQSQSVKRESNMQSATDYREKRGAFDQKHSVGKPSQKAKFYCERSSSTVTHKQGFTNACAGQCDV
jgi:hypothetical protein